MYPIQYPYSYPGLDGDGYTLDRREGTPAFQELSCRTSRRAVRGAVASDTERGRWAAPRVDGLVCDDRGVATPPRPTTPHRGVTLKRPPLHIVAGGVSANSVLPLVGGTSADRAWLNTMVGSTADRPNTLVGPENTLVGQQPTDQRLASCYSSMPSFASFFAYSGSAAARAAIASNFSAFCLFSLLTRLVPVEGARAPP